MGIPVLALGQSGTGKSASLRNFNKEDILVINVADKPLPFKNKLECVAPSYDNAYRDIMRQIKATKKKVIVVDDAQYIMSFQFMRRIKENGWDKWNDIQGEFFNIINEVKALPNDVIVYFLSHIQRDDEGYEKIKTMGKMLDEKITIEGLFTIVLKTNVSDGTYTFLTQNSGRDTVKSPMGMFPSYAIDNDLKYVDEKIRNYYEIGEFLSDKDIAEIDEIAKNVDVIKPSSDGKKRRSSRIKKEETPLEELVSVESEPVEDKPKRTRRTKKEEPKEVKEEVKEDDFPATSDQDITTVEGMDKPMRERKRRNRATEEPKEETPKEETPKKRVRRARG